MASPPQTLLLLLFFFVSLSFCCAQQNAFRPNALVLPIHRDFPTHLYVADIHMRTPQLPVPFVIHLSSKFLWVNCEKEYLSSTYHAPQCHSTQCSIANAHVCRTCNSTAGPGCHNNTCTLVSTNPVTHVKAPGEVAEDVLTIQSTQGSNPGPLVSVPRFIFSCAPASLLKGPIPTGVQGFVGFGRSQIALPTQLASHFGFRQKFAICLGSTGAIFLGDGPYLLQPGIDISQSLTYTPLIINERGDYFVGVSSIRINNKRVPVNASLLALGGTKLSTTQPYTILETSIFRAVTEFFASELSHLKRVPPVSPFGVCFDTQRLGSSRLGPAVPNIDLVMHKNNFIWRMFGANLMTPAGKNAQCLAFVDGGVKPRPAIIIGTHQLEDNLLQFDLTASKLGFSSSLLLRRTSCANFNFTHV